MIIIGAILIVLSIVLFVMVGTQIMKYVSLTGLSLGARAEYTPPFPYHGLLIVLGGIVGVAFLLTGLYLMSGRKR